jgi:hypothetical protein
MTMMMMNNPYGSPPEVQAFMEAIRGKENELSVILVGSVARRTQTENSDIDLLVISKGAFADVSIPPRVHLTRTTYDDFVKKLEQGEDFEAWCVRLGVPVHDNGRWAGILARPESKRWPSWRKKVVHGARRLFLASQLFEMGDLEAANEELLYATGHIARGVLLRSEILPLSRPELEEQLNAIGYTHLASIHKELRTNPGGELGFLRRCQLYSKKLLLHLSVQDYKRCAEEAKKQRSAKGHKK